MFHTTENSVFERGPAAAFLISISVEMVDPTAIIAMVVD